MDGSPSLLRLRVKAYGLQADRVDGGNAAASLTVFFFFQRITQFSPPEEGRPQRPSPVIVLFYFPR